MRRECLLCYSLPLSLPLCATRKSLFCMLNSTKTYPLATRQHKPFSSHHTKQSFKRNLVELKLFVFLWIKIHPLGAKSWHSGESEIYDFFYSQSSRSHGCLAAWALSTWNKKDWSVWYKTRHLKASGFQMWRSECHLRLSNSLISSPRSLLQEEKIYKDRAAGSDLHFAQELKGIRGGLARSTLMLSPPAACASSVYKSKYRRLGG